MQRPSRGGPTFAALACALAALLTLGACGQKGPLYLRGTPQDGKPAGATAPAPQKAPEKN